MAYNLLVREWRPDTWEFGLMYEVQFEMMLTCSRFAEFIQANLFPHIPLTSLFGTRVNILKPFIRSDLALKSWQGLAHQKVWIGQSCLEANRDSIFVVVKDLSLKMKELVIGADSELIQKYASSAYVEHLLRKQD